MSKRIDLADLFHRLRVNHRLEHHQRGINILRMAALPGAAADSPQDRRIAALELQLALLTQVLVARGVVSQSEMDKLTQQLEETLEAAANAPVPTPQPSRASQRPAVAPAPVAAAHAAEVTDGPELDALASAVQHAITVRRRH